MKGGMANATAVPVCWTWGESQTLQCCCYLLTFANVGLRRNIGVYKVNVALRGIHPKCWFDKCMFDNSPASKSRQITVIHVPHIWHTFGPNGDKHSIHSPNHAQSRPITASDKVIDSDKPNVVKIYAYIPNVALRGLHLNVSKYDQHGVCVGIMWVSPKMSGPPSKRQILDVRFNLRARARVCLFTSRYPDKGRPKGAPTRIF